MRSGDFGHPRRASLRGTGAVGNVRQEFFIRELKRRGDARRPEKRSRRPLREAEVAGIPIGSTQRAQFANNTNSSCCKASTKF